MRWPETSEAQGCDDVAKSYFLGLYVLEQKHQSLYVFPLSPLMLVKKFILMALVLLISTDSLMT